MSAPALRRRTLYTAFRGGPRRPWGFPDPFVRYTPPVNTLDPRYLACTDHRVACDCREAEWAEDRQEWHYERQTQRDVVSRVLAGHPTYADPPCMCTGCQIARDAHIFNAGDTQ